MNVRRNLIPLIQQLKLKPHPEGGFYSETYRSRQQISTPWGKRSASTAILFLLPRGHHSRLHRIRSDEVWHFHSGGPLSILEIDENGRPHKTILGSDLKRGHRLQHVVTAGRWFGAFPSKGTSWSLVGCTVAPGFDFRDFEMADPQKLLKAHPKARSWILNLAI